MIKTIEIITIKRGKIIEYQITKNKNFRCMFLSTPYS